MINEDSPRSVNKNFLDALMNLTEKHAEQNPNWNKY